MSKVVKKKSLFDHITQITSVQNPNYWDEISDEDKKSWSNYMVNRFLSMKTDWIELVNELQKYNLKPKELYKLYTNILPKGKRFNKYIKSKMNKKYDDYLINTLCNYFECSKLQVVEYIKLISKEDLVSILEKYGTNPKQIKNICKRNL